MSAPRAVLLALGLALFVALVAWQGAGAVAGTLAVAGWGLAVVIAFHVVPLVLDALAIVALDPRGRLGDTLVARWIGESVTSLLPAGQLGGPLAMARVLMRRGRTTRDAAAAITVSTTLQAFAQVLFALGGLALFIAIAKPERADDLRTAALVAIGLLALFVGAFAIAQRRGLFGALARGTAALTRRDFGRLSIDADALDAAVRALYRRRAALAASFAWSLVAWIVGTAECWLALHFLGHPVDWVDALLLESVGQAIRGAAFAIPGALGAQEGGFLLLAPLVGLSPATALALSLTKRARELVLGLPGLIAWHRVERGVDAGWHERIRPRSAR